MASNRVESQFAAWVEVGGLETMRVDEQDRNYAGSSPQRAHYATNTTRSIGEKAIFGIPYDGTETRPTIIERHRQYDPLEFGI